MQTFLPFSDFETSLSCLDNKRLGKQRVEAAQIIQIISGKGKVNKNGTIAWSNHPAVVQWNGYLNALKHYFNISVELWKKRGFKNTYELFEIDGEIEMPPWIGYAPFHDSHKANLRRKDIDFYSKYGWNEDPAMEYYWPSKSFSISIESEILT